MIKTVLGIMILVLYHQLGAWLMHVLHWPIPGGVAGMVLLFFSLLLFKKPPTVIATGSGFLLKYLALLFVPAGVGIMLLFDLLANEWLAMLVSMVLSTVISLIVTGLLLQQMVKKTNESTRS